MDNDLVVGIVAHVDSGKTTLAEAMLYTCGVLRKQGRVDHGDSMLDDHAIERERGITVFAKQAVVRYNEVNITLLDTPGHVDFSAETERTFQVMDLAILVISRNDRLTHTHTLFKLLQRYGIPTVIFVNKMDLEGADKDALLAMLTSKLSEGIMDFCDEGFDKDDMEYMAYLDDEIMDEFISGGKVSDETISKAVAAGKIIPLVFGSALKNEGVDRLLEVCTKYRPKRNYSKEFGARVYKIGNDGKGNRLTHVKITGGELKVRDTIHTAYGDYKVNEIRLYNGHEYENLQVADAGTVCALTGIDKIGAGDTLGAENGEYAPIMLPVMRYAIIPPPGTDNTICYRNMQALASEIPELNIEKDEENGEISVQIMGDVQLEIIQRLYEDRFGAGIGCGKGRIVYKETIGAPVHATGHFEPLRHYAEVHLLMEPGEAGSGISVASDVSVDDLALNWQRLIMTHITEKLHKGVLTGSALTDVKITVIGGRAHTKHTEGGDFRQATYRAIRQGLMQAESILLEPQIAFTLTVPIAETGRAISDISRLKGTSGTPLTEGDLCTISGVAPLKTMREYGREVNNYTKGHGSFNYEINGYVPCHDTEEVIEERGYDPEADAENPSSSVFCSHGAGIIVPWYEAEEMAHVNVDDKLRGILKSDGAEDVREDGVDLSRMAKEARKARSFRDISMEEIENIYMNTYHKSKEELTPYRYIGYGNKKPAAGDKAEKPYVYKPVAAKDKYLLVDGYNIIFAWPHLKEIAADNLDGAREVLIRECSNYQGSVGCTLILVFDAYKVKGNPGSVKLEDNIYVVYTKEAETADQYIEKTVHKLAKKHDIIVATSDGLEQVIIFGEGARRMPAMELYEEMNRERRRLNEEGFVQ